MNKVKVSVAMVLMLGASMFSVLGPGAQVVDAQIGDLIIDSPGHVIEGEDDTYANSIVVEDGGGLSIYNSTVTFDLTKDASKGIIVKRGGTLTIINSRVTSKTAIFAPVFESSGTLIIRDSKVSNIWGNWAVGGGVQVKGGKATISDTDFTKNKRDGVTVTGGSASIIRSHFNNNIVGVRCEGAKDVLIEESVFQTNTQQAIIAIGSTATFLKNTIDMNHIGIALATSEVTIKDNDIANNDVGIDITTSSDAVLEDNTISENDVAGVRVWESSAVMKFNDIRSNGDGIETDGGRLEARSNSIIGNDIGVNVKGGTLGILEDNEIGGNSQYGIFTLGDDIVVGENNYNLSNGRARWALAWTFQVKVQKHGEGIDDANITIKDTRGEQMFTDTTNDTGLTRTVDLVERLVDNAGETVELSPYKLTVKHKGNKDSKKVQVTENQTYEVNLTDTGSSNVEMFQFTLMVGILMIIFAAILGVRVWLGKKGEGPERKSKSTGKGRRPGQRAIRSTKASKKMRVRKAGKKRRKKRR